MKLMFLCFHGNAQKHACFHAIFYLVPTSTHITSYGKGSGQECVVVKSF